MSKTIQPPKCPSCGTDLTIVEETENTALTYRFNSETGTYEEIDLAEWSEIECPDCEADLSDIFPDGVGNYTSSG